MTTQEARLVKELLELTSEQNETIKECNTSFKNVIMLLVNEHKQFESRVHSMHTQMMQIKETFEQMINK